MTRMARRSIRTSATASHGDAALADVRAFMRRRFPSLADRPLNEARVCQYENSANGDFLIDFHPDLPNVLLVGAGSGHGFKHGPAVGLYAARLLDGTLDRRRAALLAGDARASSRTGRSIRWQVEADAI